jgi:NTE family protein
MQDSAAKSKRARTKKPAAPQSTNLGINLALQGGGAHGAFAWGVIDKLLEDGRLDIKAISATSAGSMNAVVMAYGMTIGGAEGARGKLEEFWRSVSEAGLMYSPVRTFPWDKWLAGFGLHPDQNPSFAAFDALTHLFSPYQLNPFNFNPLREVLEKVVDFKELATNTKATRLFVSATNVRTGKIKVFENEGLTADKVLASACLPYIFQAVEIDGEAYWDGGYMGNPAIFPLIYHGASHDVLIVHINPLVRTKLPTTAAEIFDRINEISFNSSLMREMRAIAFVTKLIEAEKLDEGRYNRMRIHAIMNDAEMTALGVASKLSPDWDFLCHLRDAGRLSAANWLAGNLEGVGKHSTVDIVATYL